MSDKPKQPMDSVEHVIWDLWNSMSWGKIPKDNKLRIKVESALKLQELVKEEYETQRKRLRSQPRSDKAPVSCLESCSKLLKFMLDKSQKTNKEESIVIDVKCICGHWGHEHPLFDSDKKRRCSRKCQCDNYIQNTLEDEGEAT